MLNVNGQNNPSWGESLLSAVHVDLTQLRAVKNISRCVAKYTTLLENDLCLRAIRRDFTLSSRVTQIDIRELFMLDHPRHVKWSGTANHSHLLGVESDG